MTGLTRWALWFGGLASAEAQWVVNAFFLTLALFAAPGGRLGDYYGHREVLSTRRAQR